MNNKNIKGNGYQCFHCGQYEVYWKADFMFEDYGFEGNGIVQECHCYSCGADITYRIPIDEDEDND